MQVPLGTYAYAREGGRIPEIRLVNVYYEQDPTNLRNGSALLTRPALQSFAALGAEPVRALYKEAGALDSAALAIAGGTVWNVTSGGLSVAVGSVSGDGAPQMALLGHQVLIATDGPLRQTDGVTISDKAFPDDAPVSSVVTINGYALAVRSGTNLIYYTDILDDEFNGDRFVTAERYPDPLVRVVIVGDEIRAYGESSIEVFVATGIDTDEQPPFQRVDARAFRIGLVSPYAITEASGVVFFVGRPQEGGVAVYMDAGQPAPISTPAIAELLRTALSDDLRLWAFGSNGHVFVVLSGATWTRVFDATTQRWCEWSSHDHPRFRGVCSANGWNGAELVGDDATGIVWRADTEATTDGSGGFLQVFAAGAPIDRRMANSGMFLDCAVGQIAIGEESIVNMRHSDTQGRTWVDDGQRTFGVTGEYHHRVKWNRLGLMVPPARIWEWTVSGPIRLRISSARINEAY